MSHNHSHHHAHPPVQSSGNNGAFVIGISLNLLFIIVEVVYGIVNNSMSLLTDAGHNLSDVASLALSLIAFRLAKKNQQKSLPMDIKKQRYLRRFLMLCFYCSLLAF